MKRNPIAIILSSASKAKIEVKAMLQYYKKRIRDPFGSLRGLSNARSTLEKTITVRIRNSKTLCLVTLSTKSLSLFCGPRQKSENP